MRGFLCLRALSAAHGGHGVEPADRLSAGRDIRHCAASPGLGVMLLDKRAALMAAPIGRRQKSGKKPPTGRNQPGKLREVRALSRRPPRAGDTVARRQGRGYAPSPLARAGRRSRRDLMRPPSRADRRSGFEGWPCREACETDTAEPSCSKGNCSNPMSRQCGTPHFRRQNEPREHGKALSCGPLFPAAQDTRARHEFSSLTIPRSCSLHQIFGSAGDVLAGGKAREKKLPRRRCPGHGMSAPGVSCVKPCAHGHCALGRVLDADGSARERISIARKPHNLAFAQASFPRQAGSGAASMLFNIF